MSASSRFFVAIILGHKDVSRASRSIADGNPRRLPTLAYVGDVPVESSYHGSALIYRLLQNYPKDKLRIIESSLGISDVQRRLPGVAYQVLEAGRRRWLDTRFHETVTSWHAVRASSLASRVDGLLSGFKPTAVLTVAHGYTWIAAAGYARDHGLPLHLIVHDDWPRHARVLEITRSWLDRQFGRVYRQAKSRFCVSEAMVETYMARYGAEGSVLRPSRAACVRKFPDAAEVASRDRGGSQLTVGFGGTVNSRGYFDALRHIAEAAQGVGGTLNVYGPLDRNQADKEGLDQPNVQLCGLVPAEEFISQLRSSVDVLFLPMSFEPGDRENMRLCFPSKLADYTAVGLPIIAYGPPDSSAIRWARMHPTAAEAVDQIGKEPLLAALTRLSSEHRRRAMGEAALKAGEVDFSHANVEGSFFDRISVVA